MAFVCLGLVALLGLVGSTAKAQSPPAIAVIDLSVHTKVSVPNPAIGDIITYTVVVANAPNMATATGVVVKDGLPADGVAYVPGSALVVRGSGTYVSTTGTWNVGQIAANDSSVITFRAKVLERGVWFNSAEVVFANLPDVDSSPNNQNLVEDDYDVVCFSVPILWYPGDEFTISIPTGFDRTEWYRNDVLISPASVSPTLAAVNADFSLTFKSTGTYRFVTYRNGCPASNCCNIEVIQGPYGSLGNYVFVDTNKNGKQDDGATGIDGVTVYLYDETGTRQLGSTVTAGGGLYTFDRLTDGQYIVRFMNPPGYQLTVSNASGVTDDLDSDAGLNGFTGVYTIDTSQPGSSIARNNPTVDAGYFLQSPCPPNFNLITSNDGSLCNGESLQLTASTSVPTAKLYWYLTPYDGVAFDTLESGEPLVVRPTTTTVYYVEAVTATGCRSIRKPIVVTVTTVPTPIALGNIRNTCPTQTVDLTRIQIENQTSGLTYEWYTSINRSEATRVTNLTARGAGRLYLFAKSATGCYSNPTVLTVEISTCRCQNEAIVSAGPGQVICAGDVVALRAILGGSATSVTWSSDGTGTFSNPNSLTANYTPSTADITRGSVLLTVTTNDPGGPDDECAAARSSLILRINSRPTTPVGVACDDTLVCQGSSTKLIGFAPGSRINWYDQNNQLIGTTSSGGKLTVTPSRAGRIVYTAEAISPENCVSTRTSLTVTVGSCLADLAVVKQVVTAGPYSVGQKITYSIRAANNGPITGTTVYVNDLLPSTLTYVSSTPAGEYNVGTGIWTVGTLTKDSNRNLLIEATINAVGSIKNTAIVGGSNNDPRYPQNDTSSVTIETNRCIGVAPSIAASSTIICKDGSTTLSATGCEGGVVNWSNGRTGLTVTVSPTITTSYSANCVLNGCTSGPSNIIAVTVTNVAIPTITASITGDVCAGTSVTLTASGCEGGTVQWSEAGKTGASIVVIPYIRTTYTAQCLKGSCLSDPATRIIDIATNLPTPTITASTTVVCPGETVTLTVNGCVGTPVWSNTSQTTASIVVTPALGTNTYSVSCRNGTCTSRPSAAYTITVVAPVVPTIVASADSICANGVLSLTATGCTGTVTWNATDRNGVSLTGSVISVYPRANISYYAQCRVGTCISNPSIAIPITVVTPSAPIIRSDKSLICSGEKVVLTAEGCQGIVKWYGPDNKFGASIEVMPTESNEYYATCKQATCESDASNRVRITVNTSGTAPRIVASATATCEGGLVSLTATGCTATVLWSDGQRGTVVSVTPTSTSNEFYAICKADGQCGSGRSNVVRINVTPAPRPVIASGTNTICPGERVTLMVSNCQGTPHWSTSETTREIVVSPAVTTSYTVYCQDGVCRSNSSTQYTLTVVPVPMPTIVASATAVEPGGTVTLTATGCTGGELIWSANDINGNNKGAVLVVRPVGTQSYYVQCKVRTCLSDPSITVVINGGSCLARAGTLIPVNPAVCAGPVITEIAARPGGGLLQPAGYSILYVLTKGTSLVVQQTSAAPSFTVTSAAAGYTIHTLVYNANPADRNYLDLSLVRPGITTGADVLKIIADKRICADLDAVGALVRVTQIDPPVLSASAQTVCSGATVTLEARGCVGGTIRWSDGSIGQAVDKTIFSNTVLTATCSIDGCISKPSASLRIDLGTPGIPTITSNRTAVCINETVVLTATGCEGSAYVWSDGRTIGNTLTVIATADVSYRVKCKVGSCEGDWSASTTIRVGAPNAPTISVAGSGTSIVSSTTVCFGAPITLTAQGCPANSYVTWSNDLVGTSITVSLATSGTYTARCCNSTNCKSVASNPIAITVLPKVTAPLVVDRTNTCPSSTVNLATGLTTTASTPGGVFEYYTSATLGRESKVANPATAGTGIYYVVEKTVAGCYSLPALMHVMISNCNDPIPCNPANPVTASAGPDAVICAIKTYQLSGVIGGAGQIAQWTSTGNGTFDNPFSTRAIYTASAEDILVGKVTLTLSVSTNNAACAVAKDEMVLTIESVKTVPTITVSGATNFCYGDSVTLRATAGDGYLWSNNARTQQIVVKTSGRYSVQLINAKGCSSAKSADVVITVAEPAAGPQVDNIRNICPSKVANLASAFTPMSVTAVGVSFEYRIGSSASSPRVMRPDSVGSGTYYIFARSREGCVSAPSQVKVNIFNCETDTLHTDVRIVKTVNKARAKTGEIVTYTIRVSNLGPNLATNIEVKDVLPKEVELIPSASANYTVTGGVIYKHIPSLAVRDSVLIVFDARVIGKGEIFNYADITYLDQHDTDKPNNWAYATVSNTSAHKPSLIGLAKAVLGTPTVIDASNFKVSYSFVLTNFGDDTLRKVQVTDDLARVFAPNTVVSAVVKPGAVGSTLVVNPAFSGTGSNTALLGQASYLAPGRSQLFTLDVMVRRAAGNATSMFLNSASVTAQNSLTSVYDQSVDGGDPDPDGDGNPTNNTSQTSFTLRAVQLVGPSIGVALAVMKVDPQADGSFNVTYRATLKNLGDMALSAISLTDSLIRAFKAPASYSVVGVPVTAAGSSLVVNPNFNGSTRPDLLTSASKLAVGEQQTVDVTVNIKPNGTNGPFYSTAIATANTANPGQVVRDISNNGLDPAKQGAMSTAVRFDLPKGLIGVAKSVGTPILVEAGVYDIPYTIKVSNLGSVALRKVQVMDNLSETFRNGALIVSNRIVVKSDAGLTVDSLYTGQGLITKMLVESLSNLPVGAFSTLSFAVRVNVKNADSLTFYNTARAMAQTETGDLVEDMSTAGINDDPDNDLDPRNNSIPTPISLNSLSSESYVGVAMAVQDTIRQADGSFNVTYKIVVKNYGREVLRNVSVTDSLSKVFNTTTGATFTIVKAPVMVSTGSALKLNPNFDGAADPRLVLGDSLSTLAAGKTDSILVTLNISTDGSTNTFLNSVIATAKSGTTTVTDISTSGLDPDLNGNNNPTDLNEREATPLNLPSTGTTLFIPQGFSPNGDGINDLFVIRGAAGQTISLEVYNRWGYLVYRNDDYRNDWDGKPNTGIVISDGANGLPDGTYYYVIKTGDGRKFVRYMTINR
ncbi:putative repeat protein (TIGR01451 family)/gliding motility-associated-like protein [Spirosoma sp. LMG 31447]|uniref:Repeat protein (TIGR01451 family)/gliding motility-associated-like protein n=3 Tax=Spirosoma utsteinense TaxID=2585773 RepID=A0ABR6VZQ2_9BACT|nr:SdrD B-like domain-containing protein [Spirosoma utsteinense]MBC3789826.1 putative repeat protein (TIGR01451 family)/gliding motility-associated-like protein [Spirosoma utsteinense]